MPKLNPNYNADRDERRPTPLAEPKHHEYDTPRKWADAYHFWRAQQPDATAWEKVIGYSLQLTYEQASRMTPGDVERLHGEAPPNRTTTNTETQNQ